MQKPQGPPAVSPSPVRRHVAPALLILGALALGGVWSRASAADDTHSTLKASGSPGSGSTATPGVSPFERTLAMAPERSLTYATLRFAVTKAVISNRVQDGPASDVKHPAVADFTLTVVNASK